MRFWNWKSILTAVVVIGGGELGQAFTRLMAGGLQWEAHSGYRRAVLRPGDGGGGGEGFTRMSNETCGVLFSNDVSVRRVAVNRIYENGSGAALGDVDGDGWTDVYLCALEGENRLYLNRGGWKFEAAEGTPAIALKDHPSTGAALADIDGDSDLDLLVNGLGRGTRLFLNDGRGTFKERTDSGLLESLAAHSMALADADGDGDLDLYAANYRTTSWQDRPPGETREVRMVDGRAIVTPEERFRVYQDPSGGLSVMELGEPDCFYWNDGAGRFTLASWTDGTFLDENGEALKDPPREWGLAAAFHDLNRDGRPDLYVCNDFYQSRDRVWINQGNGKFKLASPRAFRSMCESSMAVDFADIDRDGLDDVFVADMLSRDYVIRQTRWDNVFKKLAPSDWADPEFAPEFPRNMLYLNRGNGTYAEIARLAGLHATDWTWNVAFMDVDLDGYEDALIGNGYNRDMLHTDVLSKLQPMSGQMSLEERIERSARYGSMARRNLAFRNGGNLRFEDASERWGFNAMGISQGMALGDLDNDGDLDLVLNNFNQTASLYRNDANKPRIAVRLKGAAPNTRGVGARVTLEGKSLRQSRELKSGGRYLSSDDFMIVFAAIETTGSLNLQIAWPNGREIRITDVRPNSIYEITQTESDAPSGEKEVETARWFEDVSDRLSGHRDQTIGFNDYFLQPGLPWKLSHAGPSIGWFDMDDDGWDELLVGGGAGGFFSIFQNLREGRFHLANPTRLDRDQTAVLGWKSGGGVNRLAAGFANYRNPNDPRGAVRLFSVNDRDLENILKGWPSSAGPLAMADFDCDGDLDLFVGGRFVPGRYPEPADSKLLSNQDGAFVEDDANSKLFKRIGLVSGAVFSDLNGDGYPDLALACEWGPVRLFANIRGKFREITEPAGMSAYKGLWQSVAAADFNGDGRMDLIAGNWGRNHRFTEATTMGDSLKLYWGDFNGDGRVELFPAYYHPALGKDAPWKTLDEAAAMLPPLRDAFSSAEDYALAGMDGILAEYGEQVRVESVNTFETTVFLSDRNGFTAKALPVEAQFAPVFGITPGDFDGDGNEDVFLAQNCFAVESGKSRQDAGAGLLLRGDGAGGFQPLSARQSGIEMYGEQRSAATGDFDRDGRNDLAVSQYQGSTRLFKNTIGAPGLRVRLAGPVGNPEGVGTQLALVYEDGTKGLIRELKRGSGHWSQDSNVLILPNPDSRAKSVWVRWPRGKEMTVELPDNAGEILLDGLGRIEVLNRRP